MVVLPIETETIVAGFVMFVAGHKLGYSDAIEYIRRNCQYKGDGESE